MIDYSSILSNNYIGKQWVMNGESYDKLVWLDDSPKPTKDELDALWESTKKVNNNNLADYNRRRDYVIESDPIFFKAQRDEATMEEWQAKILEIKARHPKV